MPPGASVLRRSVPFFRLKALPIYLFTPFLYKSGSRIILFVGRGRKFFRVWGGGRARFIQKNKKKDLLKQVFS